MSESDEARGASEHPEVISDQLSAELAVLGYDKAAFDTVEKHRDIDPSKFGKCPVGQEVEKVLGTERAMDIAQRIVEASHSVTRGPTMREKFQAKRHQEEQAAERPEPKLFPELEKKEVVAKVSLTKLEILLQESEAVRIITETRPVEAPQQAQKSDNAAQSTRPARQKPEIRRPTAQAKTKQILPQFVPARGQSSHAAEVTTTLGTEIIEPAGSMNIHEAAIEPNLNAKHLITAELRIDSAQYTSSRTHIETRVPQEIILLPEAILIEPTETGKTEPIVKAVPRVEIAKEAETTQNENNIITEIAQKTTAGGVSVEISAEQAERYITHAEVVEKHPATSVLPDQELANHEVTYSIPDESVVDELFSSFIETLRHPDIVAEKPEPVLFSAIARLQEVVEQIKTNPDKPLELSEQTVEDIVTILTCLGCDEPREALIKYTNTHNLRELFASLESELPELSKLIDYQQHLLAVLARVSKQTNRHVSVAEILTRLLFVANRSVATLTT